MNVPTVPSPDSVLNINGGLIAQCALPIFEYPRFVVRVQHVQPAGASVLVWCLSGQFRPTVDVVTDVSIGCRGPNRQSGHRHESPVTFLAGAQCLFCPFAFTK